ncbi:MAG TPA: hypothetical protein PKO36_04505 [Candidatus Hydrogenedentes bacterium]|nr:hypothetical protein [Candidatus Hydrogenedentota bacterium]HOT49797.1 hypothetical protein [Candidatus Hydrogenedentota bacterium]HOV74230.1 hypothetical protein [Candidatus Hydrogenedentota bacterium]HPC15075.1 hypothetical protein [Candidatus Hydrogenedentota bacterium]HRT19064.1 hypothetical protein [Candidatus Hydrogenedentota bacterium]
MINTVESVAAAAALFPVQAASHIVLFRRYGGSPMYIHLLPAALLHAFVWLLAVAWRSGGMPNAAQTIAGVSLIGFLCLSYAQVFSLTIRGFSLRILVDIHERGPLTVEQIMAGYSEGRGLDWMFEKRLAGLESVGMIRRGEGSTIALRPLGLCAGLMGLWTKRLLNMGPGG